MKPVMRLETVRRMPKPLATDFSKLWTALSISLLGSEVTALALPLIAVRTLRVSAVEMGVLAGVGQAPFLLFSLPAGAWVDRLRRRPVLIATDVGSAILLLSVPLAVLFGGPAYLQLCLVAFGIGTFTVVSEVAHYAYVPTLVPRRELTRFNSRLQVSHSASAAGGPGLAGILIQLLTAPFAVLADAVAFLCSAALLRAIRKSEPPVRVDGDATRMLQAVRQGLRFLLGHRLLRPVILFSIPTVFSESGLLALYVLYATRHLHLSPLWIGLVFAAGGIGAIPGAVVAERAGSRFGVGPTIIGGYALAGVAAFLVPLAGGPIAAVIAILALGKAFGGLTDTTANVHQWTLRQTATPDQLQGRVTASHRFTVYGAGAVGGVAAGALASAVGVRTTLFVFASGMVIAPLLALASPLRNLREQPADVDDEPTSGIEMAVADDRAFRRDQTGVGGRSGIHPELRSDSGEAARSEDEAVAQLADQAADAGPKRRAVKRPEGDGAPVVEHRRG